MSTIELKGLTKRFDQLTAVREIDLQVALAVLEDDGLYAQILRGGPITAERRND